MAIQSNEDIEEFAKLLVQRIRDEAVKSCNTELESAATGTRRQRWQNALGECLPGLAEIIPDIVDEALFHLLDAIDEGMLQLSFRSSRGNTVDLGHDGKSELGGYYLMWCVEYAQTRFNDDFAHLATWPPPDRHDH